MKWLKEKMTLKNVKMALYIIISFLVIVTGFNVYGVVKKNAGYAEVNIDKTQMTFTGYEKESNNYINIVGDASIHMQLMNTFVKYVTLEFSQPLEENLDIAVYYQDNVSDFNESTAKRSIIAEGSTSTVIPLGYTVETLRVDIGNEIGQKFTLESIVINDKEAVKHNTDLLIFEIIVKMMVWLFILLIAYLLFIRSLKIEKCFIIVAMVLGIFYMITITPLSVPDEQYHYHSAYKMSNIMLLNWDEIDKGDSNHFNYSGMSVHNNAPSAYSRVMDDVFSPGTPGEKIDIPTPNGMASPICVIPQAIGVSIGRALGLNVIWLFYLGRLCNLVFYVLCVYYAIKKIPFAKIMLFMIAIMPMALHQAASFSYDAFTNAIAFLVIAYLLSLIYEAKALKTKDTLIITGLSVLLGMAKLVYFPIIFLSLLIPKEKFHSRKHKFISLGLIICAGALIVLAINLTGVQSMAVSGNALNWEGMQNYTLAFALQHPFECIKIFIRTLIERGVFYIDSCIGSILSGLSLPVNGLILMAFKAVIVLSSLKKDSSKVFVNGKVKVFIAILCMAVIVLVEASMFFGWTSQGRIVIEGIQGRYFIPLVPLGALLLRNKILVLTKNIDKWLIVFSVFLSGAVIWSIINFTMKHI